jgi:hypothetical protein
MIKGGNDDGEMGNEENLLLGDGFMCSPGIYASLSQQAWFA